MKKVGITGGLGFIGSHLTELLVEQGVEVIILDSMASNTVDSAFMGSLAGVTVFTNTISDSVLERTFEGVDTIFHLASVLGPSNVLNYAGRLGQSIVSDTLQIRDACEQLGATLIDVSTSEVYGHPGVLREDSEKVFPGEYKIRTEYGAGKMLSEMAVVNYSAVHGTPNYHFIRPFNVTGPRQKPDGGFVLPRFAVAALTGQPITVFGNGSQRRAYTHVIDICEAIIEIAYSEFENEIWNIGNPENEMSIKETADLVVTTVKEKFPWLSTEILFIDPKEIHGELFSEAIDKVPYIEKINSKLGWSPRFGAKQIVEDVVDFYAKKIASGYTFSVMGNKDD